MDAAFLVVVSIGLVLLSAMTAFRLSSAGVAGRRIAVTLVELWIAVGLWLRLLNWVMSLGGRATVSPAGAPWLADLIVRLRAMSLGERALALGNLCVVAALIVHFMWSVSRLGPRQANS